MLVNIVGQDPDVRVFLEHVCERLEIGFGIAAAGRVRRRVQDQPAGLGCDRCFQLRRGQFEIGFLRAINDHRYTVEQDYDIRIADPIGCRHNDFVARVQGCHHGVEDDRLAAAADVNFVARVGEAIVALVFANDGVQQFRCAIDAGVAGYAFVEGFLGGIDDMLRRVEIRLAGAERNNVASTGGQVSGFLCDLKGGRRFDGAQAFGDDRHRETPQIIFVTGRAKNRRNLTPRHLVRQASASISANFTRNPAANCMSDQDSADIQSDIQA